jgi:hypothetical protein
MQVGCLLVEMHDSRPTKGGPTKSMETRIDKYVLRPTAESLWADIRSVVDSQRGWGDKEALELEARIVVCISTKIASRVDLTIICSYLLHRLSVWTLPPVSIERRMLSREVEPTHP